MHKEKITFFRSLVFHHYKTGMNALEIFKTLKSIYDNECPSYSFVKKWRGRFVCGQESFEDEPRQGKPMRHGDGKYYKIMRLVEEYPYISVKDIAKVLGFSNIKTKSYIKKESWPQKENL